MSAYRRAADQCRGDVSRPMALLADKHILCFNDYVSASQDLSLVKQLEPGGLFVASAYGGDDIQTMALAELLAERNATVVIYDHCFSACASYLLTASSRAIVLKDALVAWQVLGAEQGDCLQFVQALDKGPQRYDVGRCPQPLSRIGEAGKIYQAKQRFFEKRRIDPLLEEPPESAFVRTSISNLFSRLKYTELVMWTWNPRYYASSIKTNIVYEAYPKSQREVDAISKRLRLFYPVIYDP
ncbi:hypothetical protein ACQR1W_35350 [Bradyrhizobium sp. HKCCYLS1011]|uniref:hypothetical protein n=1 Tax=Bradyrhizobium sp. HKCCYLS1011 TaxID=3420733 RepID=UPI003EB6BA9D